MFKHNPKNGGFQAVPNTQTVLPELPGYMLPLDYAPIESNVYGVLNRSLFPSALDDRDIQKGYADQPLVTLREIDMVNFMEELTDIPEWWDKVHDPQVAEKWKKDALESKYDITPNMAKWIIDELRYKSLVFKHTKSIALHNGDICKSDIAVPMPLLDRLRSACHELESAPLHHAEIVPRTKSRERGLIPMGFYPLVYGRSRILQDRIIGIDDALSTIGDGEVIPRPQETGITREDMVWRVASRADLRVKPYSTDFQMLPSDLKLGPDGKWHIVSYINNLHPVKYRETYNILEEIINCTIPVWNVTLTPLKDMLHSRARILYHKAEYYPIPKEVEATRPQFREGEWQPDYDERLQQWKLQHYKAVQPDADEFKPWAVPPYMMKNLPPGQAEPVRIEEGVELNKDYAKRGLQMFFRILDVQLDQSEPTYEVDWHITGRLNEHICATAFMLLESVNLEDIYMSFRQMSETATLKEIDYEPDDWVWLKQVFGLEPGDAAVQNVGRIKLKRGRVVMYPSTIQSRMERFCLKDKTKSGFARGLALYLVDPNIRIISTANIPPQRLDWTKEVQELGPLSEEINKFPDYVIDRVLNRKCKFPFRAEEADEFAGRMWKEAQDFTKYQAVAFYSNTIEL